ncbi:MAG TPA: squalene synthase HpnC [Xanthobacteraceae bacterium]|nr:squalene synthase HpnC [Xanthobacteraceae bacterium]
MTSAAELRSGKGHHDENFPVASWLIHERHRPPILAFYEFVRVADDIADHSALSAREKIDLLDRLEAGLLGRAEPEPVAARLRAVLAERDLSPRHAQDLLTAFRMDATKLRYRDWDDLIHYCSYSAMPVGRFVLDVHGDSRSTWPANDALCASLQIINHVQDCGKDYRNLDRVYIPEDALARHRTSVEALAEPEASPELRNCLRDVMEHTVVLLRGAEYFSTQVNDLRFGLEIAVIYRVAQTLTRRLLRRDPLSERVHLNKAEFAAMGIVGAVEGLGRRAGRWIGAGRHSAQDA